MRKIFYIAQMVAAVVFLASCGGKKGAVEKKEERPAAEKEPAGSQMATLTAQQLKSIDLQLGSIQEKQLTSSLKANGFLKVPNQNKASITSLYSGTVKTLRVQPGSLVNKGQVVAAIVNPQFIQLQEEFLTVSGKAGLAELEYKRQKELTEGNAGALKNLQQAETELKTLQGRLASLVQQLQLMGISPAGISQGKLISTINITSPIKGTVSSVRAQIGTYIDASAILAEVVDNSQLHVDLYVYEKDLPKLKDRQTIHFTLTNNPGQEYDATIYSIGTAFEAETKAIPVHAQVKGNKAGLIEGMNITAIISLEKATVPAVPTDAIVNYQGQDYIFIVSGHAGKSDSTTTFQRIPVARGTSDIGYTEITLLNKTPGDAKVVIKGAFFILAKMTNTGEEEQ